MGMDGVKKTEDSSPRKTKEKWEDFIFSLMSAVDLVGGVADAETFGKRSLEKVYKEIYPNGIRLTFVIEKDLRKETYM